MIFLLFSISLVGATVSQSICEIEPDLGNSMCANATSSIRFYHDKDFNRCLPFRYSGCGGNENNFEKRKYCRQKCIPLDHHFCPANTRKTLNKFKCETDKNCGDQEFCSLGMNDNGICCSLEAKQKVEEDRKKTCSNGKKKFTTRRGDRERVFIGKSCKHNFCPIGYTCQKGNFYSFCCEN